MPKSLVVDASFTVRLILPGPDRSAFRARVDRWLGDGCELYAPELWLYEMASAVCKAVFFGTVTVEEAEHLLPLLYELDIRLIPPDADQTRRAFEWTQRMSRAAAYDSFYLALAESLGCELWTADRRLHSAAGVPWAQLA